MKVIEKNTLPAMTLKTNKRTRRYLREHHDSCTVCLRDFANDELTHLGRTASRKLEYVGNCCANTLTETIIRHSYAKLNYSVPRSDAVLWRFMDFTKFVSILKSRALYFARADQFEDPFEGAKGLLENKPRWDGFYMGFFAGSYANPPEGTDFNLTPDEVANESLRLLREMEAAGLRGLSTTFINCWHENPHESEAMWKLYVAALDYGVSIRTTYNRLYKALSRDPDISIGRVNYVDFSSRFVGINDCFWHKRVAFKHEQEVRLIIKDFRANDEFGKLVPVKLDTLIESIHLSPTSPSWFRNLVEDVMSKYGLTSKIESSRMTDQPFY